MSKDNYLAILGIDHSEIEAKIHQSYKRRAKENESIENLSEYILKMKELNEAYLSLSADCDQIDEKNNCLDHKSSKFENPEESELETEIEIERDKYEEDQAKIVIKSCTAYLTEPGEIEVIGEAITQSGRAINKYKEIKFDVYDDKRKLIGTNYTNWSEFGRRQSFKSYVNYKPKKTIPTKVRVYPGE